MAVNFTVNGREYSMRRSQVEGILKSVTPEHARRPAVEVNGKYYPVRQAFEVASGLDRSYFVPDQVLGVFEQMGFIILKDT